MNDYRIERKIKGTRVLFFPTVNGKRLTNTNFARKYDARGTLRNAITKYGEQRLHDLTTAQHGK
jgi:hypothetical protein